MKNKKDEEMSKKQLIALVNDLRAQLKDKESRGWPAGSKEDSERVPPEFIWNYHRQILND